MPWNLIFGGVTGLIGSIVTSITNFKTQKLKNEHEIAVIQAKTMAMRAETDAAIRINAAKVAGEVKKAEQKTFETSIVIGNKSLFDTRWIDKLFEVQGWMKFVSIPVGVLVAFFFGMIDALRSFTRPGLSWLFVAATLWLTYTTMAVLSKEGVAAMTAVQSLAILGHIIDIVLYLTVSCVTWWFGDRSISKFLGKIGQSEINNPTPPTLPPIDDESRGNVESGNPF